MPAGTLAMMLCKMEGAILQPQPPPWASEVRGGCRASGMVWMRDKSSDFAPAAGLCAADEAIFFGLGWNENTGAGANAEGAEVTQKSQKEYQNCLEKA